MTSYPLRDESGGRLKGWPGGGIQWPGSEYVPLFRPACPGEHADIVVRRGGRGRWRYCKYCYMSTLPLRLCEWVARRYSEQTICSACGYGLDPPEEFGRAH